MGTKIADAEKLKGNDHWTVYDGKGGVWRASRDKSTGLWHARETNGSGYRIGNTLMGIRQGVATHQP